MSAVLWYTYADGVRLGPMSWDEVRAAARDGSLKPGQNIGGLASAFDQAFAQQGGEEWRPSSEN